jgi:uncharacterized membrane protein
MVWERFPNAPICNGRRDRAPCLGPYACPICWRCIGALGGMLMARTFVTSVHGALPVLLAFVLALPAYVDGIRQYEYKIESTNTRRVVTGILLGFALRLLRQSVISWVT